MSKAISRNVTERKRQEETWQFLFEAGSILSSSLDYQTTLTNVAHLAVPGMADWCTVHVVEEDETIRQLAVAHVNPAKVVWAQELGKHYPYRPDEPRGLPRVLKTGQSEFYPEISDAMLEAAGRDPQHLRLLRDLGLRSAMIVPIHARQRILGAITFIAAESGRIYDAADLALAEELARRAALAVDNARLFAERRHAQEEAETRARQQKTLAHLGLRALAEPGLTEWMQEVVEGVAQTLDVEYCKLLELLPGGSELFLKAGAGWQPGLVGQTTVSTGRNSQAGYTLLNNEPVIVEDLRTESRFTGPPLLVSHGVVSGISVIIYQEGGKPWGVMGAHTTSRRMFTPDDVAFFQSVANLTALVLQRYHRERQIAENTSRIHALNTRLKRAMSETHHRVKNNLQVISALVDLQVLHPAESVSKDELRRVGQHIRALAAVHDLLTHRAKSEAGADFLSVKVALDKLVSVIQAMVPGRRIHVRSADVLLPVQQSTALSIILNEAVSNAIKHAATGDIEVTFTVVENRGHLTVADRGPGFPAGFQGAPSGSTGLDLIESLATMDLRGAVRYESRPEGGAQVIVEFPLPQEATLKIEPAVSSGEE